MKVTNKEEVRQAWKHANDQVMIDLVSQGWEDLPEGIKVISRGFSHNGLYHIVVDGHIVADVDDWSYRVKGMYDALWRVTYWSKADSITAFNNRRKENRERAEAYRHARKIQQRFLNMGRLDPYSYEYGQEGGYFKTSLGEVSARGLLPKASVDALAKWDYNGRQTPPPVDGWGDLIASPRDHRVSVPETLHRPKVIVDGGRPPKVDVLPWQ